MQPAISPFQLQERSFLLESPLTHTHPFAGLQILFGVLPQAHQKFPQYHLGRILCGYPQVLLLQYYPANLLHSFFFSVPHGKFLAQEDARQKTKDTETQIKSVNEQIHYLGQYLSTKSTYNEFLKARFKGKFRKDHADEIEKHEKAAQILKAQNPDGSLPKMKDLKLEKERLLALKAAQYDTYTYYKDYQKELRTACANVDSILGQHHIRDHIQRTEQTL